MEFQVVVNKRVDSVVFEKETGLFLFKREEKFFVSGAESQQQAQSLVDSHNPPEPKELTIEQKLANVGININDLRSALM